MAAQSLEMSIRMFRPAVSPTARMGNYALVRVSVPEGGAVAAAPRRGEVMLLLDRSGSMDERGAGGKKHIVRVVEAAQAVVEALQPQDRLGIVAFDDKSWLVAPLTSGEQRNQLRAALDRFKTEVESSGGGGTNMAPALRTAMNELSSKSRDPRAARLVLLTDGQAADQDETLKVVAGLERQSIATLGFGGFDFGFMTKVCEPSKGLCEEVGSKDPSQVKDKFLDELGVAQDTVASNLRLKVRFTDAVLARKTYIVKPRATFLGPIMLGANREVSYSLPPLEQKFGVEILFDVVSLPQEAQGRRSLGEVTLLYDVPGLNLRDQTIAGNLVVEYTSNEQKMSEVDEKIKEAYTAALDEEKRLEYDKAIADGDQVKADAALGTLRRSDNKAVADLATKRQTGMSDEEWKKQGAQATRRKTS